MTTSLPKSSTIDLNEEKIPEHNFNYPNTERKTPHRKKNSEQQQAFDYLSEDMYKVSANSFVKSKKLQTTKGAVCSMFIYVIEGR